MINEERPLDGSDLPKLSGPAQRALYEAGVRRLEDLRKFSEADLMALHGFGKGSLPALRTALAAQGWRFRESPGSGDE